MGMSLSSSALASTRKDFRSGWGWLSTGALASRLSVKPSATARAAGEPAGAMKVVFLASICSVFPTRRKLAR